MKSIGSIVKTSFLLLSINLIYATDHSSTPRKRGRNIPDTSASNILTLARQTEPRIERPYYEAGVLVGDYLYPILFYCLILALRFIASVLSVNTDRAQDRRECDQAHVHQCQIHTCHCPHCNRIQTDDIRNKE